MTKEKNESLTNGESFDDVSVSPEVSIINVPTRTINIERELELIEKDIERFNRISILALKLTKPKDWVMQGDSPYLMDRGAEKIGIAFGVDISGLDVKMEWTEDDKGRYYYFTAKAQAFSKKLGRYVEDIGTCSQRDKFFGYDSHKQEFRAIEKVDMMNIKKKSVTNLHNRLIRRATGIVNVTIDDLKQAGIDVDKIGKIDYTKKKELTESGKDIRKKLGDMLLEMANNDKEVAEKLLQKYSEWTNNEGQKIFAKSLKGMSEKWLMSTYGKVKKDYEKTEFSLEQEEMKEDE